MKTEPDCEFFLPLIEIGERIEVTYPIEQLEDAKIEKVLNLVNELLTKKP